MYVIELTPEAIEDLKGLTGYERKLVLDGIGAQLSHQPAVETRNRKRLRPNSLAEWEIRVGKFRAFYDVDEQGRRVKISAVGQKVGNRLLIGGKEYEL